MPAREGELLRLDVDAVEADARELLAEHREHRADAASDLEQPRPRLERRAVGFQDDATFRWAADRAEMLDLARDASTSVIRTTVVWRDVAPTRPAEAANP